MLCLSSRFWIAALAVLRELWRWRETEAVAANRPPFFILAHEKLVAIADALLAREVLDADQVRRLAYGQPLDEIATPLQPPPTIGDGVHPRREKERPSLVSPMPKPLTQE